MPAAPATSAAIRRAISAVTDQGLVIGAVEVTRDGTIRIETRAPDAPPSESLDRNSEPVHPRQPKKWARG